METTHISICDYERLKAFYGRLFEFLAFELRSRQDVDELQVYLQREGIPIVDPAAEYYEDHYAVFFLDPDGLKLEGMKWGEKTDLRKGIAGRPLSYFLSFAGRYFCHWNNSRV